MSDPMSGEEGIVFNIQRHSVHDGPGIRTIVFLKGCPLACRWCCNPESQDFARELAYNPEKCIGCGACLQVCPEKAIRREGESLVFLRELCAACGLCAEVCYAEARVMEGWRAGAAELVEEVLKDEIFFRRSGGGLTLSGGEPLAQRDFAAAILRRAKAAGLHTAVETAGHVPWDSFLRVLPHVDLYLFDIKHADPEKHRRFIGEDNRLILENLRRLSRALAGGDPAGGGEDRIIVRTPVVPGFNDSPEELADIADIAARAGVRRMHLLPFHRYGSGKYRLLGKTDPMAEAPGVEDSGTDGGDLRTRLEAVLGTLASKNLALHIGG